MEKAHRTMAVQAREIVRPLQDDLTRAGFRIDEEDETGWQFKYRQRRGGYYFNAGCSNLIVEGKIALLQIAGIEGFVAAGARIKSGAVVRAEMVVPATGYKGQSHLVRKLFGDGFADRAGPVGGIDRDKQDLRNLWMPTGQPGRWFIAGSFAQCRIYSKVLALQIKARQEGLVPLPLAPG